MMYHLSYLDIKHGIQRGGGQSDPPSISWFSSTPAEKGLKKINFIPNSHAYLLTDTYKQNNFCCGFTVLVTCRLMQPRQGRKLKIHQNEISFLEYTYRRCKVTPNQLDISMLGLYLAATFFKTSEVRKNPRSNGPKESKGTQTKTFV